MFRKLDYIRKWEVAGIFWIIIVGSLLHFTFEWSGNSKIVAIFSTVNESVWEHLKLGYFALLFFIFIEYWFLKDKTNSFFLGKFSGILAMELTILIIYYSYHWLTKESSLVVDICSFILGAIICQLISIKILKSSIRKIYNILGLMAFIFIGFILILFTFFPPKLPIFMDSNTGEYGIGQRDRYTVPYEKN